MRPSSPRRRSLARDHRISLVPSQIAHLRVAVERAACVARRAREVES
jgi:hypothetical protein